MNVGQRIHTLREQRGMSQGDLEHATGMLRCYISRVEHGHTVPSVGTLERFADALKVPVYKLFVRGTEAATTTSASMRDRSLEELAEESGAAGDDARFLLKLRSLITNMPDSDRTMLLDFARRLGVH